jgi:biopolymer transport protein ExbB/TolQ
MNKQKKSPWLKGVIISGVFVVLPPLVGLVPTVIGMLRAFRAMGATGTLDKAELSQAISFSFWATMVGFGVSSVAVIALVVCVVGLVMEQRKRGANNSRR